MGFYDMAILPGNLSYLKGVPSFFGSYYQRLSDREPLTYVNSCVDAAIYPEFSPSFVKTSSGTTIGPFTTSTHIAVLTAKMSPVVVGGSPFSFSVTLGPKDRYVHVAFSGTLNVLAADANNYICWGIRVGIADVANTIPMTKDDDIFRLVGQLNVTGFLPIAGYEVFDVVPGTPYVFTLVAGYYGSTLPTQSFTPYGAANQPFNFHAWIGG